MYLLLFRTICVAQDILVADVEVVKVVVTAVLVVWVEVDAVVAGAEETLVTEVAEDHQTPEVASEAVEDHATNHNLFSPAKNDLHFPA